ncbi:MAG: TIGR03084 family metal-binding protein [Thermodesulfobacteriota bacterium]
MKSICRDLQDEYEDLDTRVSKLDAGGWSMKTLCAGWTVKDQICHIAYFDAAAFEAINDAAAFAKSAEALFRDLDSFEAFNQKTLSRGRQMNPAELLSWWRRERGALLNALLRLEPKDRIPWYGPPMSAKSFATARLMETWAHGQDVNDALGSRRIAGDRLRHIAHLGVKTFGWSFANRGLGIPDKPVRVELIAPSGVMWEWGPPGVEDSVRGLAEEFCLVVTQRRHYQDTNLEIRGVVAEEWMRKAQAFAGPPDNGPPPGMFPRTESDPRKK